MRKTASIFISFVLFVSCYGEDLESIYEKAKQNDPVFGIAKQNLLAAREKPSQAVAGLLPTINLNINSNQLNNDENNEKRENQQRLGAYFILLLNGMLPCRNPPVQGRKIFPVVNFCSN